MTIEKQYCTLLQAKRLKELGVEQISQFYWSDFAGSKNELYIRKELGLYGVEVDYFSGLFFVRPGIESGLSAYSAYTVAELGIMLPVGCQTNYNDHHGYWICEFIEYWDEDEDPGAKPYPIAGWKLTACIDDEEMQTEAKCRAALLIHLIENNIVSVKEINKRLQNS